jgi:hypothetical protein
MRRSAAILLFALVSSPLFADTADLTPAIRDLESLRGLRFTGPVAQKTITRADLRSWLEEQLRADLSVSLEEYIAVLRTLRLIDDEPDPVARLLDLYQSQVLAFYDPRNHVYYSLDTPPPGLEAGLVPEEVIVTHELMHALQDQAFEAGSKMLKVRHQWDQAMAYQALLEGEATLVMLASLMESMGVDLAEAVKSEAFSSMFAAAAQMTSAADAVKDTPRYFVESMTFPYLEGLKYVLTVYRDGGWEAVDRLHRNPPQATSDLLHPGRTAPSTPAVAPIKGALLNTALGEFHWRFLLGEQPAAGWAADQVAVLKNTAGAYTVLADTRWTSDADAREFAAAVKEKFEGAQIKRQGTRVRFAYGADRKRISGFLRG